MRLFKRRAREARTIEYDTGSVKNRLVFLPVLAIALALLVELMNRGLSPARLFQFVVRRPVPFLYNALIILTSLVFSELFRRRRAVLATIAITWLALGIVQYIVIKDRTQPFCSVDILMIKDAFSLITVYYTWPEIILMFGSGFAVIFLVIMLFARMKRREKYNFPMSLAAFVGFVVLCVMLAALGMHSGLFPQRFESLVDAYNDYGFATCFTFTFGQRGINRPDAYSAESVAEILDNIDEDPNSGELVYPVFDEGDNLAQPNIVFVQLESFFDVHTIIGSEYSADPTPFFTRLCNRFPSGLLYVPTIGGGTANTEFEVITGLNLDFFGAGEYPYNTILQEKACETVGYDLKDYGYATTAMHNNSATFYSRNAVYPKLGFDRFVSLEYMQNVQYNALGWAKDGVLTDEILAAMETTKARDMVFCVAVESHGKYGDTYEYREGDVQVLSLPEQIPLAPFQNFINALSGPDAFLESLVRALVRFNEPTIVVVYGDHLPALELENDMLSTGSVYASRYVVWNNFGAGFDAPDLQAYRLSANLLKQLGFSGGVITKLHQSVDPGESGEEYLQKLEMLEYDMLYGDQEAFEGEYPYIPVALRMGSRRIAVTGAERQYRRLLVTGENFTEFSSIVINDQAVDTLYIDTEHIVARVDDAAEFDRFWVAQIARDGTELSRTGVFRMED